MKKIATIATAALCLSIPIAIASSSSYEREAKAELKDCIRDAREPGYEIITQTTTVSACLVSGFVVDVDFYKVARCSGPSCDSVRLAGELIGTAHFDCDTLSYGECYLDEPTVCYTLYAPVCGDDGVTYSNDCYAEAAGVSYTDGACDGGTLTE